MDYKRDLYIMMEGNYIKENGRNIFDDNLDLFPIDWYLIDDYVLKTGILYEAIKNKKKIIETDKYKSIINNIYQL